MLLFFKLSFSYTSPADVIFNWGGFLTHPMLASFLSRQFLLHIGCWLHVYLGSFSYTSHASFTFLWGVSLTHPKLASFFNLWSLIFGEFFLHIPCWLPFPPKSFVYTSKTGLIFVSVVSLTHPVLASFLSVEFLTHPMLALLLCGEFLLHIPSWLLFFKSAEFSSHKELGSFTYKSRAGFIFICGVYLQHHQLDSFLCGEFLLHIPCWLYFYVGSFFYISGAAFLLCVEFPLHIPCSLDFYEGVSLTYSVFVLLLFYRVSFFYPSRAGFIFISGVSLTQPILASFLSWEFLLHIPCWLQF